LKHIRSRENPFFKELTRLTRSARARKQSGQTLLDGAHLLTAYLASGKLPEHVLVSPAGLQDHEVSGLLEILQGVPVTLLEDGLFSSLSELKTPTGVLTLIERPQHVTAASSHLSLLLEDIQDPGNVGSMIRSAAAAGCGAVYLSPGCADAWSPKVLRAGMGGHFALEVIESPSLAEVAAAFPGRVYAAVLGAQQSLYQCDLKGLVAFAVGNEGAGLTSGLREGCQPVAIPMPGKVESLNAAAAAAICLFEAARQRSAD